MLYVPGRLAWQSALQSPLKRNGVKVLRSSQNILLEIAFPWRIVGIAILLPVSALS